MSAIDWSKLDPECVRLCKAIDQIPGIESVESCCGHGERPYHIWFLAESLGALPNLLYWFNACHSGIYDWRVIVLTDCAKRPATFMIEGPPGDYSGADEIARIIEIKELGIGEYAQD